MREGRLVVPALIAFLAFVYPTTVVGQVLEVQPTMNGPLGAQPFIEACLYPGSWPTGWDRVGLFGNVVHSFDNIGEADLAQCLANVHNAGKHLVVQMGVLKQGLCNSAQACWAESLGSVERIAGLGGYDIDYFYLDEPWTGWPNDKQYAIDQTIEWIRIARLRFPNVRIILVEAFPNHPAEGLSSFFADVHNGAIVATGWGIQYAQIDHDWNDAWDFYGVKYIQDSVHANGMQFGVIFWGADPGLTWYDGLQTQGVAYRFWRDWLGVAPDLFSVDNWVGSPYSTIPEQRLGWEHTFTNSVRDFANTFMPVASSAFGLQSTEAMYPGESRTSIDGRFRLQYQYDGNLVLVAGSTPIWASGTWNTVPGFVVMQGDGNLVVYDAYLQPRWASNTCGNPGAFLIVQSDGNLVVYQGLSGSLWASGTNWY